jgi:vacuolar-type H+-ATPase subunit I/STV1
MKKNIARILMVLGLIMVLIGQNYSIKTSPGLINIIGNPIMIVSGAILIIAGALIHETA